MAHIFVCNGVLLGHGRECFLSIFWGIDEPGGSFPDKKTGAMWFCLYAESKKNKIKSKAKLHRKQAN